MARSIYVAAKELDIEVADIFWQARRAGIKIVSRETTPEEREAQKEKSGGWYSTTIREISDTDFETLKQAISRAQAEKLDRQAKRKAALDGDQKARYDANCAARRGKEKELKQLLEDRVATKEASARKERDLRVSLGQVGDNFLALLEAAREDLNGRMDDLRTSFSEIEDSLGDRSDQERAEIQVHLDALLGQTTSRVTRQSAEIAGLRAELSKMPPC